MRKKDNSEGHCKMLKWKMGACILMSSKDRLTKTLQFNGNYMIAARKSCQWWRSRRRHGRVLVISRCSVEVLATAFQWSCLAKHSRRSNGISWYLCTSHALCIWFHFLCFHNVSVTWKKGEKRYCVRLLLFFSLKWWKSMLAPCFGYIPQRCEVQQGDDSSMAMFDFTPLLITEGRIKSL